MKKSLFASISSLILTLILILSTIFSAVVFDNKSFAHADTSEEQKTIVDDSSNKQNFDLVDSAYDSVDNKVSPTETELSDLTEQINLELKTDKVIGDNIKADLTLSEPLRDYYYVAEDLDIDNFSIDNNEISAKINAKEGLGKLDIYIKGDADNWQKTSIFTYTTAEQSFLSIESEDDAWYKAYLNKYEQGLATEDEIQKDYAVFSRRDIEETLISDNAETHFKSDEFDLQSETFNVESEKQQAVQMAAASKNTYIKGRLTWTTSTGYILPLKYTRVDLYDKEVVGADYLMTTYTDNNGNYSFTISNADSFWDFENGGYDVYIKCYPDSYTMQVARDWLLPNLTYYYVQSKVVENIATGSTTDLSFRILYNENNMGNCAFYVEQGMVVGQRFASAMGMSTSKFMTVTYPFTGDENAFCYDTISGIGQPYFNDFDTLMHEYGHFVEGVKGTYGSDIVDFILYNPTHYSSTDHFNDKNSKRYAMELTWSEAWATAFAQIAQEYYKSEYSAYVSGFADKSDGKDYEKYTYNSASGEAQEDAVIAFLWDLYDTDTSEAYDNIGLGYYSWWACTTKSGTYTLTDFINVIDAYYPNYRGQIGEIMGAHQISPSEVKITNSASVSKTVSPTLSWKINGSNTNPNNRFQIVFFDSNYNKVYSSAYISTTSSNSYIYSYSVPQSVWNQVIQNCAGTFTLNIAICAYHNGSKVSGPYYSKYVPIKLTIESNIAFTSSTRYAETLINLDKGEAAYVNVTFNTAGYKLIQTFGSKDTYIYLYNSTGTLVASNDDSGYGLNGLISYYVSANTQYRIRVRYYGSSTCGKTKLSITPAYGALKGGVSTLSCYEDIYSTSNGWISFAEQNYTRMVTYTPSSSGTYTFELSSTYDNYIYVIDPRSSEILQLNVDYNDDGGTGLNAKLSKYLVSGVPYLIIYCKYNPGSSFSSTDDISISLSIYKN